MGILTNHMLMAAAGAQGGALDVADVFSTDLYTGNGSAQTITNGIDLTGEGGLVWTKRRDFSEHHALVDTDLAELLKSSKSDAASSGSFLSFNSDGYDIDTDDGQFNGSTKDYTAWTFRKAPKFFDIVTYTGNGVGGRSVPHNLGSTPGMIVVKRTDNSRKWFVQHRSVPQNSGAPGYMYLNGANSYENGSSSMWPQAPNDTDFFLGTNASLNGSGGTYVAYLFAHDLSSDGLIQCGSYTGNGSPAGKSVSLGWEPQYLMVKRIDSSSNWWAWDNKRSPVNPRRKIIRLDDNDPESDHSDYEISFDATGFTILASDPGTPNASGGEYIYMAIRAEGV